MRLAASNLRKAFAGRVVVESVSLSVDAGVIHGLLGPNGAGKTTVFRMIAGLLRPDAGVVTVDGEPLTHEPLHRRARMGIAYLPQEDTLFRELTVAENVALAIEVSGSSATVGDLLDQVGIGALAPRAVPGLSGGERRRLQIARLLALSPRVLLLDEPFAGVDPVAVSELARVIRRIASVGVAVLVTDHAVRDTLALCHRATVIDQGVVQVEGDPATVAADPRARARYLGADFSLPPLQESC